VFFVNSILKQPFLFKKYIIGKILMLGKIDTALWNKTKKANKLNQFHSHEKN